LEFTRAQGQWGKDVVLAVFSSGKIPGLMEEDRLYHYAPLSLLEDRDVLMARFSMKKDFAKYYKYYESVTGRLDEAEPFVLPKKFLYNKKVKFLYNKKVVAAMVSAYPEGLLHNDIPSALRDSKTVFLSYTNTWSIVDIKRLMKGCSRYGGSGKYGFSYHRLITDIAHYDGTLLTSLVGEFSMRVRSDLKTMLEFIQKVQGFDYLDLVTYLPAPLLDNVEVAQALCRASDDSGFQYFSERVRANREIVCEVVRSNGQNFQFVDDALRGDEEIVKAACLSYSPALLRCDNATLLGHLVAQEQPFRDLFYSEGYDGSISSVA